MGAQLSTAMVKKVSKGAAPKETFPKNAIEKKGRTFSIGGDIMPKRDLTRFVRWPKYVRLQRAKMTLLKRIKIPPAINQFQNTFDKSASKRPVAVKMGLNHVTSLVEEKKAKLVVIAHDVDPIEIIVWLPALCKARGIPYCIIKSKARLGAVVGKKTATCLAITDVKSENKNDLDNLVKMAEANFNDVYDETMKKWGDAEASGRQMAATLKRQTRA